MTNTAQLRAAAIALGHAEPISIEPDNTIWLGTFDNKQILTDTQLSAIYDKAQQMENDEIAARQSALAKLAALGLTDAEIKALVG